MATASVTRARPASEHRFYLAITLAMLATVLVGFARSFFLRPLFPAWPAPSEPVFYLHGAVFTAWPVLLVLQALLVSSGRTGLHRRLGVGGVLLALVMVVLGTHAALLAAARPTGFTGIPVPPLQFLVIPLLDMVLFASFVGMAVARRRDAQAHKRWMLLASVNLLAAAIARWPGVVGLGSPPVFFVLTDLFIVGMVVWDVRSRGRVHPVTAWGGALIVLSQPLRLVLSATPAWMAFARWAVGTSG
jgi:uncharacterized membrane protein YozB (DUF420 family)